jgi:hypothetical protein
VVDTTRPTSRVNTLAAKQTSLSFTVSVTGSDPVPSAGVVVSGVAGYDVYMSVGGGAFSLWQTLPASSPSATFTGQNAKFYAFRSVARDAAGNVESKPLASETLTYVPDVTPPTTQVDSVASTTASFGVQMSATDVGGSLMSILDLYVSADGGAATLVRRLAPGTADGGGAYHVSTTYQAISDGTSHSYRFYTVGRDGAANWETAPAAPADVLVTKTFAAASPLAITAFDVQRGAAQRSFVQYVDVTFNQPGSALTSLVSSGRVRLTRYGLDGVSSPTPISLAGLTSVVDHVLSLNFGGGGIGGGATSQTGDGYYELAFDLDNNGTFETMKHFYRLLGDTNGDRKVDAVDLAAVNAAFGHSGTNMNEDVSGDGLVNIIDRTLVSRAQGRSILATLSLDD